jgi:hypothetical protein
MAYDAPNLDTPDGLEDAIPDMISKARSHAQQAFAEMQEEMTDFYKGELPGVTQEDVDDGRSDIVSRDVHDAVMATMPDLLRIFTGPEHLVEFEPSTQADEAWVEQATEAVRNIFEKENDGFSIIHGSLKDGLIRKFAVATWWHEFVDKSYVEDYSMPEDEFAMFMQENGDEVEVVSAKMVGGKRSPKIKAKVRHTRYEHKFNVELVPPEELILSPSARTAKGDHLIGRQQNLAKERLIGMGYEAALVDEMHGADKTIESGGMASARQPEGATDVDAGDEDEILYVECFVQWPHEGRMQLFKVCTMGNGHEIVACEPVDEVNMALFTPDPEPHTPVGESQAEKVADIQRLKTGVWRGIVDSLAESLIPRMEVVEGQTNIEDAMSTEIGGLIRVRQPNMVRPVSQPFVGQQAMPLLDAIDTMREERVGAFRAADGLSSEAMQSSTKMAVAATISGSKAQKELLARIYAWTFLRPVFRGLLRLFVQHQDKEKTMKLTGGWVQVDPRAWHADLGCSVVNLTQAMLSPDEKAMQLGGIAEKQEQIIMQMGPINPLCNIGMYAETLREMVKVTGRRNLDKYFNRMPSTPMEIQQVLQQYAQFSPPPQPDPAQMLAEAQIKSLDADAHRKAMEAIEKSDQAAAKLKSDDDFRRDQLEQEATLKLFEIEANTGVKSNLAQLQIQHDRDKNREQLEHQAQQNLTATHADLAKHDTTLEHQAEQSDLQKAHEGRQGEQQRQHEAGQADIDRTAQFVQGDLQAGHQATQADLDREHQAKLAAAKTTTPAKKPKPKK